MEVNKAGITACNPKPQPTGTMHLNAVSFSKVTGITDSCPAAVVSAEAALTGCMFDPRLSQQPVS